MHAGKEAPYRQSKRGAAGNHDGEAQDGPDWDVLQMYRTAAVAHRVLIAHTHALQGACNCQ